MNRVQKFHEALGRSPNIIKKEQALKLVRLYQRQRAALLTLFCLSRGMIRNGKQLSKEKIYIDKEILDDMESMALLNAAELRVELGVDTEEELVAKLRELLDAVYQNCEKIARQTKVKFREEGPGELNIDRVPWYRHVMRAYRKTAVPEANDNRQ